ncbi:MAG: indolepyruvate ferredoxin oxidoreductase subunit alpha [Planctomycetota bacterium]
MDDNIKLLSGNEAIARGAFEAGVRVATAYPGTPSTEILETIIKEYKDIYAEWSINEKVALEVAAGASLAGARALVAMKHVGLNVASDPLFSLSYTGVKGGLVIISADDPGMHSSQNEQDNRLYAKFAKIPLLEPTDSQECKELIKEAFKISEEFDTPVLFRVTTRISHTSSCVKLDTPQESQVKGYEKQFTKYNLLPVNARKRHIFVEERLKKLQRLSENFKYNTIEKGEGKIGYITSGVSYQYVKEIFPEAPVLKCCMTYPLPISLITQFVNMYEKVYVVEELEPFIEEEIKKWGLKVYGKEIIPVCFELNPDVVDEKLAGKERRVISLNLNDTPLPVRPPVLCPGCPHRGFFYIANKMKLYITGDIGCYTLGALPPLNAMDTCICMGASIGNAHGIEKAGDIKTQKKLVAVIGDSTFLHSGITGLINSAYNKSDIKVAILYNYTTAMTGHQPHPASKIGTENEFIDIKTLCYACGIKKVIEVDAFNLEAIEQGLKDIINFSGPAVIIVKGPCIFIDKNIVQEPLEVQDEECVGCKVCLHLGCPAISAVDFSKNGKVVINEQLCVGCKLCQQVCPVNAIVGNEEYNKER